MGINVPDLDDREFEEIFEEVKRQIPVHSDEWTDHNTHDTGIAILEMLSWISETYTYQLDRVTDAHREKYLRLLGLSRQPPQPATTRVSVTPPPDAEGAVVPAGEPLSVDDRSGVTKTFETVTETELTEAQLAKVVIHAGDDAVNKTTEARTDNTHFQAFGDDPARGDAIYLGLDGDPFSEAETLTLTVDFHDEDLPEPATHGDIDETFDPSVEVSWQYCTSYQHWEDDEVWADLTVLEDETNAFYRGGTITLETVPGWDLATETSDDAHLFGQESGLVWIRCRIDEPGYEFPPRLDTIRLNVLEVSHQQTIEDELLRRADETLETTIQSNQEFFFEEAPVLEAEISIDGEQWTEVDDLDRSGPTANHYELNYSTGSITFGDGMNGSKPPVGKHVVAKQYVHGGGTDGNISADSHWEFKREDEELTDGVLLEDVSVTPTASATGGTDMESIDDAMDRFKRDFKRTYRAATLDDYVYAATHTPGLRFGRAHATTRNRHTAGGHEYSEIDVVVVPYSMQAKPMPSKGFIDAVETHLERTRLLTDPVTVLEPTYVDIGVDIVISALPGYTEAELTTTIRETLYTYLHAIDGTPWPFGQSLYTADVRVVIEKISGVRSVHDITLSAHGEEQIDDHGNVLIANTALLSLSENDVTVTVDDETGGESR